MIRRRRGRRFERLGSISPVELGLPPSRERLLTLTAAWAEVAGEELARRAVVRRVSRGTLEIDLVPGPWTEALTSLWPQLAASLAARYPRLGVRKVRWGTTPRECCAVRLDGEAHPVGAVLCESHVRTESRSPLREPVAPVPTLDERLRRVAADYLTARRALHGSKPVAGDD